MALLDSHIYQISSKINPLQAPRTDNKLKAHVVYGKRKKIQ